MLLIALGISACSADAPSDDAMRRDREIDTATQQAIGDTDAALRDAATPARIGTN